MIEKEIEVIAMKKIYNIFLNPSKEQIDVYLPIFKKDIKKNMAFSKYTVLKNLRKEVNLW